LGEERGKINIYELKYDTIIIVPIISDYIISAFL
jgi:hypothetical protein